VGDEIVENPVDAGQTLASSAKEVSDI